MAQINLDWEDLGRTIEDIVDRAVSSQDYQKLDQTIRQVVGKAVDIGSDTVRKVVDSSARPVQPKAKKAAPAPQPQMQNLSLLYRKTNGITAGGILKIVGGGLLSDAMGSIQNGFAVMACVSGLALICFAPKYLRSAPLNGK